MVIHHLPGYDRATKEIVRRFADDGLRRDLPEPLLARGPGAAPDDAAATARAQGGMPDERLVGDVAGAAAYLRALPTLERQGRRDRLLLGRAAERPGRLQPRPRRRGRLLRRVRHRHPARGLPAEGHQPRSTSCPNLRCPLLGLFGNEDSHPSPAQVDEFEQILKANGKTYEFHRYDDAGHAFFAVDRPSYRVAAANDGWERIAAFYGERTWELTCAPTRRCTPTSTAAPRARTARGSTSTRRRVYFDHPVHAMADHSLNIDFADPSRGPSARVALELTAESARQLVAAIQGALASAPADLTV